MLLGFLDRAIGGWPAAFSFGAAGPSCWRFNTIKDWNYQESSHHGLGPGDRAIVNRNYWSSSHRSCNVIKRQGYLGGWKNDGLIGKKPPNLVGTEEENEGRKDLIVVQSFRINLCSQ